MFSCDHCKYQIASIKILEIHNRTFHNKVKKYDCDLCGYQVSYKNNLARHKKIVHERVKFPCRQCNYQATSKGNLAKHKRAFILAGNATIKHHHKELLLNTEGS